MANRTFYPSQSTGIDVVYMQFELKGAGASALTLSLDASPVVASVVRNGTGLHTVTLKDSFSKVLFKCAEPDDTANDGSYCTVLNVQNESTSSALTFQIQFRNAGGTAAEAASGRRIGVVLALRNGNVGIT